MTNNANGLHAPEMVAQLLLAATTVLDPDRAHMEGIDNSALMQLSQFLPIVTNGKAKATITSALNRMGCGPDKKARNGTKPTNVFSTRTRGKGTFCQVQKT